MLPVPQDLETAVLVNEPLGSYFRLVFEVRGPLLQALPGQFVNLQVSEGSAPLLRRPFSIARPVKGPGGKRCVEIVYAVVREGTRLLSRKRPGSPLKVLGPLGRPFPMPARKTTALLVGGGAGIPPIVFLSLALKKKGQPQRVFLGARTKKDLVHADVFRRAGIPLTVTTDDGSAGRKGLVTEEVARLMPEVPPGRPAAFYACGPRPMLRALSVLAAKHDAPAYLSWEELMGCGLGICLTCVCPTKDGMERTCTEGPVFEASRIDWDRLK